MKARHETNPQPGASPHHQTRRRRTLSSINAVETCGVGDINPCLLARFTGYPQIGSGELHIAHMLWGGLLLFIGAMLMLTLANRQVLPVGAILTGVGVGLFIEQGGQVHHQIQRLLLSAGRAHHLRLLSANGLAVSAGPSQRRTRYAKRELLASAGISGRSCGRRHGCT